MPCYLNWADNMYTIIEFVALFMYYLDTAASFRTKSLLISLAFAI